MRDYHLYPDTTVTGNATDSSESVNATVEKIFLSNETNKQTMINMSINTTSKDKVVVSLSFTKNNTNPNELLHENITAIDIAMNETVQNNTMPKKMIDGNLTLQEKNSASFLSSAFNLFSPGVEKNSSNATIVDIPLVANATNSSDNSADK